MDFDGTRDARGTHADPVPRPAAPPGQPAPPGGAPPRPAGPPPAPGAQPAPRQSVRDWLNAPRPDAALGIWRFGYVAPKASKERGRLPSVTVVGLVIPLVIGLIVWSLWRRGNVPYQLVVLKLFTPDDWWWGGTTAPKSWEGVDARIVYDGLFFAALVYTMGRLGSWREIAHHFVVRRPQPGRALVAALAALLTLSFVWPEAFPGVSWDPLPIVNPVLSLVALIAGGDDVFTSLAISYGVYTLITVAVLVPFARLGGWWPLAKERFGARPAAAAPSPGTPAEPSGPPAEWPELRATGQHKAAELLSSEVLSERMNDVDCARIVGAWTSARREGRLTGFSDTVLRRGAAAWTHPSGARDLPVRSAAHDLLASQVRLGRWVDRERTPAAYSGAGAALGPATLGTSLLAVGPSGSGKTRHLVRPVAESLGLQALTARCAVVVVAAAGTPVGPDGSYDVVVKLGDPESVHDLDLYADCEDPDEAAAFLAEGLVGSADGVDVRRAATALAQLLGPYRAVHGAFPTIPVLRELLEGVPALLEDLRHALTAEGHPAMLRELEARLRQSGGPNDPGPVLADRLALLDRPVFADFFGSGTGARPFSLRAVAHHPLRVRVDLPERGYEEASQLLTRLLLAQFAAVVRGADRRGHFACLVLDDATGALTAETVRRVQGLRAHNAGVVLALRSIGDIPESLHGPLYGAVGCRMAFSGVTTWDGGRFAESWGTEWVEARDVAKHTVFADQPMTRAIHALRKLVTGKAVTTDAVTVRQVERERWSASELAHAVPPGHAVLSLTSVKGEHAPPLLVDLRG
ncbi:ATP/GTP-binding protein [Streptomyces aureus]|uniref:ATP/GTP-binding protein n=1 Tax=Streptomyces aureus TaxID=193461 RepID=UPI00055C3225|nr:ATP/GTP-binding protein [Streptomyces aureus]